MRIAILAPIAWNIPPRAYGPWEAVAGSLADGLASRGVDVTLFATARARTRARLVATVPAPYREDPVWDPRVAETLHWAACFERAGEFDIIHNHTNCYPLAFTPLIRTPVVTTLHGSALLEPWTHPLYRRFRHLPYVSISDAERAGLPELNYVATVYNGIDLAQFTFRPHPGSYLVFLGRMSAAKGVHLAIAIARRAGVPLRIAAHIPPDERDYFDRMVRPQLGPGVEFVGEVGPPERDVLLGGALALLHPTTVPEPFGLTLVEAQATGTPVIGFNRGAVPELVRDGETGFVVEDVDQAVRAVARVGALDRRRCRQWVEEHFTVDRMVDGYLEVYRRLLGGDAGRGTMEADAPPWPA
ncbi:MAG: glycosyltransferase family 4 protein [Armatimonadota bacterium]|nr:glycosyltransferase family 4 protein [Armatimonadota bacterium]